MDYGIPGFRKSKRDKKAKRLYRVYKKGGKYRNINVEITQERKSRR